VEVIGGVEEAAASASMLYSYRYLIFIVVMSSFFLLSSLWLCHDIGEAFWPWFLDSFFWCGAFVQH
jgi:hypothetical protein